LDSMIKIVIAVAWWIK